MMMNVKKIKKRTMIISLTAMIILGMIGTFIAVYTYANGVTEQNDKAIAEHSSNDESKEEGGYYELVSVKLSDESKFNSLKRIG